LLGNLLVLRGLIVQSELEAALARQERSGERLGAILVAAGYISEQDLVEMLADQYRMPTIDLGRTRLDPTAIGSLSRNDARRYRAVPVRFHHSGVDVAIADPADARTVEFLIHALHAPVHLYLAPLVDINAAIDRVFNTSS
jgi:MSHA biogenesis protein MshE